MTERSGGITFREKFIVWDSGFQKHYYGYVAKINEVGRLINVTTLLTPLAMMSSIATHNPVFIPLGVALSAAAGGASYLRLKRIEGNLEKDQKEKMEKASVTLEFHVDPSVFLKDRKIE